MSGVAGDARHGAAGPGAAVQVEAWHVLFEDYKKENTLEKQIEIRIEEMTRIYQKYGVLKPSIVVTEASDETSPIHDQFQWNDELAAKEYRLTQARRLIRVTPIMIDNARQQVVHVPSVITEGDEPEGREGEYHPITVVCREESMRERAIRQLVSHVKALQSVVDLINKHAISNDKAERVHKRIAKNVAQITRDADRLQQVM